MAVETKHYVVQGRVQGVGFRYFVCRRAQSLGVGGWVRNLPDGEVEVLAQAEPHVLLQFEQALIRGPRGADVESIRVEEADGYADCPHFIIEV